MTDTTLVSKAAELPTSTEAHMHRAAVLLAVLQRLDDPTLPQIMRWTSDSRDYSAESPEPALHGELANIYDLAKARTAVRAWAIALGTTMIERHVEDYNRAVVLQATALVDGVRIRVGLRLGVYEKCPGCGGPAIGDTVLRHFTDAPCSGAPALQA